MCLHRLVFCDELVFIFCKCTVTSREGDCSGDAGRVSQCRPKPSALEQMGVQAGMSWAASAPGTE